METNSLDEVDHNVSETTAVNADPEQNIHQSNATSVKKEDAKSSDEKRFSLSALSDLLDEFLNKGDIPESCIDQALILLRFSPTALIDVDESSIVATLLTAIQKADELAASKYLLLLSGLLSFTVSSRSLRLIINYLMSSNRIWRPYSYELIHQLKIASSFPNNMSFFIFPGESKSILTIPPISKFPYQNGWTFQSWVYIDPPLCKLSEVKPRYLFSFQTDKGLGYTAHFLGTLFIITSIRAKDKGLQHCVPTEFHPCRWYMLTIAFVYNRWTKSELRCYVNGKITSSVEMAWPITGSDPFERCVIGGSFDQRDENVFSGRIASITGFTEALSPQQISALYTLGPNYKAVYSLLPFQGQLRFESEVKGLLSETGCKALIESKLSASIMFVYHPLACDHNLCLDQSPKLNAVFAHSPHGLMQGKVRSVRTTSLQSSIQSLGGIQLLYLLFEQLDFALENAVDPDRPQDDVKPFPIAALLFNLLFDLARTSYALQDQLARTNGLVVFAQALWQSSPAHLTESLLNGLLEAARYLTRELLSASPSSLAAGVPSLLVLFRQLFNKLLFANGLWLRAPVRVQDRLYGFLADEFRVDLLGQSGKSIVASALHAIKYYFWMVQPTEPLLDSTPDERPSLKYLARIRSNLLLFIKPLILQQYQLSPYNGNFPPNGEEVDYLFNFLCTVRESDNLKDVLYFAVALMSQHPAVMVPCFDRHDGIQCVFQLLTLPDEDSRLYALKLLGFFLKYSKSKRKQEAVAQHSIFSLLCDRFAAVSPAFTMKAYNVFFELLTEDMTLQLTEKVLPYPSQAQRIENPALLKTIALLIIHSKRTAELMTIRQVFLEHLLALCLNSDVNRRAVLQMSVWQDWVIGLASLFPQNRQNSYATATVMEVLRCLLFYALRFEFGGWRVWIDTLAILHSRIAFEEFRRANHQAHMAKSRAELPSQHAADPGPQLQSVSQPQPLETTESVVDGPATSKEVGESSPDVKEVDLTDKVVRKLVDNLLDQLVLEAAGPNEKVEGKGDEAETYLSADATALVATAHANTAKGDKGDHAQTNSATTTQKSNHAPEKVEPQTFRIPPFTWSYLHQLLLDSVLRSIEDEFHAITAAGPQEATANEKAVVVETETETESEEESESVALSNLQTFITDPANQVYVINLIHLVSQLSDGLVTASGGLLPLLAATTSPTMELEVQEPSSGLSLETALGFLLRVANIADVVVFMPSINLGALEKETGMNSGGIVRQCLRLACLCAVRNSLEARLKDFFPSDEILSQLYTHPAPHHHTPSPLPPLDSAPSIAQPSSQPSLPLSSSTSADLAETSNAVTTATAATRVRRHSLSAFYFYGLLRHKIEVIQRLANPAAGTPFLSRECVVFLERLRRLPPGLQRLVLGLRPSMANYSSGFMVDGAKSLSLRRDLAFPIDGGVFDRTVAHPLADIESLLQNVDINRLHNIVYREEEETRQVHFVALAVIYFLSVLMVSKYRDLLDPVNLLSLCQRKGAPPSSSPTPVSPASWRLGSSASANPIASTTEVTEKQTSKQSEEQNAEDRPSSSQSDSEKTNVTKSGEDEKSTGAYTEPGVKEQVKNEPSENEKEEDLADDVKEGKSESIDSSGSDDGEQRVATVHQYMPKTTLPVSLDTGKPTVCSVIGGGSDSQRAPSETSETAASSPPTPPHLLASPPAPTTTTSADLTDLLERALGSSVPLLKNIFFDFETFLAKALVGSHGQDLLLTGGLSALRNSSLAVEIVMLLCSQEWQNSLQKHAGLAFIELVNECRLLAKASREHFISVAHEADFILARLRSLELRRQTAFRATTLRRQQCRVTELDTHQTRRLEAGAVRDGLVAAHCLALTQHLLQCLQQAPLPPPSLPSANRCDVITPASSALLRQMRLFLERTKRPPIRIFYRLDTWEDDSRRRRRLVINPFGSSHPEATLHSSPPPVPAPPPTLAIDSTALNLLPQSEQQQHQEEMTAGGGDTQRGSVDSLQPPSTPSAYSPLTLTEASLAPGLVSTHQDVFTFGQLEPAANDPAVVSTPCQLITAGAAVYGILSITSTYFAFETDPGHELNQKIDPQVLAYTKNLYSKWPFSEIRAVFTRRHLLRNVALEIFLTTRSSVLFALPDESTVRRVVYALPPVGIGARYGVTQSHRTSLATGRQHLSLSQATQRWQRREMSNFDYLMCLNTLAGRSLNDLNQYPIFPWVLTNYTDSYLDLNEPANYRDLSKPVGALDPARKAFFDERYADWDDPTQPAFHYGTHYSTAAFVLNYLIRLEPFTTLFLNMQGGKFDHPNRMFYSVEATWAGCLQSSTNVKELIPEFFYLPEMFENTNDYDFGALEDGTKLGDVILPPWATSPEEFVRIHRQALESELVSCQLHHWIDLIFGYKQRGQEAVKATNVFHYLTYEDSVNWDKVTDPVLREALEGQITCFGQTPSQLLTTPHPPRGSALAACPRLFAPPVHEVTARLRPASHASILGLFFVSSPHHGVGADVSLLAVSTNCVFTVNKWNKAAAAAAADSVFKATSPTPMSVESSETSSKSQEPPPPYSPLTSNLPSSATLPVISAESQVTPLLTLDPTPLAPNPSGNRRYIGENMDPSIRLTANNFVVTGDGRAIVACGYFDYSFRIFSVDSGRCVQSVCGHQDVVTCLGHSESTAIGHCYLASGGRDGLVCLWIFDTKSLCLFSEHSGAIPMPHVTLVGHQNALQCIAISAELGLVFRGACLLHTTQGELLRRFEAPQTAADRLRPCAVFAGAADAAAAVAAASPTRLVVTRHGYVVFQLGATKLAVFTLNARLIQSGVIEEQSSTTTVSHSPPSAPIPSSSSSSNGSPLAVSQARAQLQSKAEGEGYAVSALAVTRCAHFLLAAGNDGIVSILHLHSLRLLHCLPRCKAPITALDISPDHRFIVVGLANGGLVVFNVNFNRWREEIQGGKPKQQQQQSRQDQDDQQQHTTRSYPPQPANSNTTTSTTKTEEREGAQDEEQLPVTPESAATTAT
ncbi:Neurobeachin [Echinococcus granulosus]|uniref:Neurobeachin n=1 Tax=Echinococcus granulosus TaxID=6210 RepID=W6UHS2_ECHGR|nr:Neurobeachin [Echinococcus granulosus]EUB57642.1 Neurobeachin [Echinococcus granulosus]